MQCLTFCLLVVVASTATASISNKSSNDLISADPKKPGILGTVEDDSHGSLPPNRPELPEMPEQLKVLYTRHLRSKDKKGHITFEVENHNGQQSWTVEGEHTVWKNDHGSITVNAGVKQPFNGPTDAHVGVSGKFEWR